jgi:site-specific DNA-cytosine methylase
MNPYRGDDPSDIPLFVDLVARLRPRFFVMDDLPGSLRAFKMHEYSERLPDYDLFPEWVSNYHYGNVQKNRRRMFMLGALKTERWAFVPGEREHETTVGDVLGDILGHEADGTVVNHEPCAIDAVCQRAKHLESLGRDAVATYADLRDYFLTKPEGHVMRYVSSYGTVKVKPSHARAYWDGHGHVLDGTAVAVHPVRATPYTVRERARLQGFPDDFVFYGTRLDAQGRYDHEKNPHMVKQTGKAMPVQFCEYVCRQIMAHLHGEKFEVSGRRLVRPDMQVSRAKEWYCENVGYADQARACAACWLYAACRIRHEKYKIGPALEQPSLPMGPVPTTVFEPPRPSRVPRGARPPREKKAPAPSEARPRKTRFTDSRVEDVDLTFEEETT